ncbi:dipeptidase [Fulvimonas soli]|jgi:membrane dipeptidase|uniref:Membrane dipeptidase n=1 Tax=Fulvimonas soli TaxID=155197 RepID=A0A316HRI5_9GAMM|nr:dipeptidase [Fulvimonas soli]PWK82738.1 membrane dipeptidase [Fulvimonas soli]TNY26645.1 membrane dipeptidase [Fulvimonas soli]
MNTIRFRPLLAALALAAAPAAFAQQRAPAGPLTLDTHVDIPFSYMREPRFDVGRDTPLKVDLGKMERGGLDAAFFVVWVPQHALDAAGYAKAVEQAEQKYEAIGRMLMMYPDRIRLATTPAQVRANRAAGLLSAMIGIENAYSLGHDLHRLDAAYDRGARYVGLVHVGDNDLCTSSLPDTEHGEPAMNSPGDHGMTDFGRAVVKRANQLGIMVDVSHASDACVRDALKVSTAPVIASHSGARAALDHPRNLPDDLLRAIAAKGGVIQAVAYKEFLKKDPGREAAEKKLQEQVARGAGDKEYDSDKHDYLPAMARGMAEIQDKYPLPTVDDFVAQIRHMVRVAGIDHVGIASDFDGGGGITGWADASETRNVTAALRRAGFGDADIAKLWSGNLLRVWAEVERAAEH